jgi:hypothetical protein
MFSMMGEVGMAEGGARAADVFPFVEAQHLGFVPRVARWPNL